MNIRRRVALEETILAMITGILAGDGLADKGRLELVWKPLVKYYEALEEYLMQGNGLYITDSASMDDATRNVYFEADLSVRIGGKTKLIDIPAGKTVQSDIWTPLPIQPFVTEDTVRCFSTR